MQKHLLPLCILITSFALLPACATNLSGETYSRDDARVPQRVEYGTVEQVRPVVISGTNSNIGTAAGAVLGGIAASTVGGGRGKAAATVAGAVAGGVVGTKAEEATTRAQGVEITVRLANGNTIAVVQEESPSVVFQVGERVRILNVNGRTRVAH